MQSNGLKGGHQKINKTCLDPFSRTTHPVDDPGRKGAVPIRIFLMGFAREQPLHVGPILRCWVGIRAVALAWAIALVGAGMGVGAGLAVVGVGAGFSHFPVLALAVVDCPSLFAPVPVLAVGDCCSLLPVLALAVVYLPALFAPVPVLAVGACFSLLPVFALAVV